MAVSDDVHNDDDDAISSTAKPPTKKRQLELLGIKQSTGGKEDRSKRKSRKGFWKKLSDELRQQIVQWICNHNQVVHSRNARDTLQVKDEAGNIRKHKLNTTMYCC